MPDKWDYHSRIHKEVWDAEVDKNLLKQLRKRAEAEPELKQLLQRRKMLEEPKQPKKK